MAEEIWREGGCLCGGVRYRAQGEPFLTGLCHCADCRKESGSVVVAYGKWRRDRTVIYGDYATYAGRSFCPACGSRLFNLHEADVEFRIGSLDAAPNGLVPMQEGWICRREDWLAAVDGATQSERDTPL